MQRLKRLGQRPVPLAPDHPLASRNAGEEAGRDGAAGEGEHGDGQPNGEEGRGGIAADDQAGDRRQEEQVHQDIPKEPFDRAVTSLGAVS